uniref:CSON005259 protein n=1 Tax=Culicoides sonorensis TaxID=179676 RepID=A0A336K111_CULSO
MVKDHKINLLFLLLNLVTLSFVRGNDIAIDQVVSLCCNEGEQWGVERKDCSTFEKRVDVADELQGLCLSTVEICCSKQHQIYQCMAGQTAAKNGLSCLTLNSSTIGSDYFKNCCESCKVGLLVGSTSNRCILDPFYFGVPWDEVYLNCCNEIKGDDNEFILTEEDEKNLCQKFDKLCTQICENSDNSYICSCYEGYILLEDKRTCVPAEDNLEDNDINFNGSECRKGFQKDPITNTCKDIDECAILENNCNTEEQVCFNTEGSYKCLDVLKASSCQNGFRYNVKTETCQDINECELEEDACEAGYVCKNVIGSFECVKRGQRGEKSPAAIHKNYINKPCELGFRRHKDKCVDIDECISNPCDLYQTCTNEIGGFRCDCKIGFTLDPKTKACVDINECQINNHECLESQRCDNTIGSYTCIRLQSCGTGYTLNAETGQCDDDDECALGRHNCQTPYECRNTKGSFRCVYRTTTSRRPTTTLTTTVSQKISNIYWPPTTPSPIYSRCDLGFQRNDADINECERRPSICQRNYRCINTNGSYRCMPMINCPGGFMANNDATQCVDIDECATGEASCGPNQICKNKPGGYLCSCPPGHAINKDQRCEDINECESYKDTVCEDIDECREIPGLCHQRCINYWGSYRCGCEPGFKLNENNRTCDDINECEVHKSYNLCMGICQNTPGSYNCACPPGFILGSDGRICEDIDECEKLKMCNQRNEVCTNLRGSYRCTRIDCPYGYAIDPDRKNRCKRNDIRCDYGDNECLRKPSSISYNFITLTSNISLPLQGRPLFNLRGPNWYENIEFDLKVVRVDAPPHVQKATQHNFSMTKSESEVLLSLVKTIQGPQDIELELIMTVYQQGIVSGTNLAKIITKD